MAEPPPQTRNHVPVTMGAAGQATLDLEGLKVASVRFEPDRVLERHTHERPTVGIMLRGSFDLAFRRHELDCTPFTLFTEPGGEVHANHMGTAGAHVLAIQPDPRLEVFEPCLPLVDGIHHLRDGAVCALARRLAMELENPDDLTSLAVRGLALDALASASRRLRGRGDERRPPPWLARVEERLRDEFRAPPTLADLGADVSRHPSHVARVFRRWHGVSVGAFVRGVRVDWAAARLLETDEPLARVAIRAGFADQSHLTRAFRARTGCTPGAFRRSRGMR